MSENKESSKRSQRRGDPIEKKGKQKDHRPVSVVFLFAWHRKDGKCKQHTLRFVYSDLVTRGGIEPPLQPWKGRVLTSWPTSRMVAEVGFEPTTCRVWTGRSSQLSYSAIAKIEDSLKPCWNIISRQRAKVKMFCKDFRIFGDFSFFGEETDEILQLRE